MPEIWYIKIFSIHIFLTSYEVYVIRYKNPYASSLRHPICVPVWSPTFDFQVWDIFPSYEQFCILFHNSISLSESVLLSVCSYDKTLTRINLEEKRVYLANRSQSIRHPIQELKYKPQGKATYWLAQLPYLYSPGPLAYEWHHPQWAGPSYITQ